MIKQMERQFMLVAVLAISLVMLLILSTLNVISKQQNIEAVDKILVERLKEPDMMIGPPGGPDEDREPRPGGEGLLDRNERRSFFVVVNASNQLLETDAYDKNIVLEEEAYSLAIEAAKVGQAYGFAGDYRFTFIQEENQTTYFFLDYTFEQEAEQNLLLISIAIFFASIILVAILVKVLLRPFMKPIRKAFSKQKRFITDASHELKTPLTVIATNMQLIEMESGPTDWTASVSRQTERLKALTNELVTLARMDEENSHLMKVDMNFSEMVEDVVMGFDPAFLAEGKTLTTEIEEDLSYYGDYDALERLVSVLLSNALKYSNDQGKVKVSLKKNGKKLKLKVVNTTEGIDQGPHNEFFERFYRTDGSRNSETGGFGIGLAIAKSTVEEHNGKIEAVSTDGESLTVRIVL